MATGPFDVSLTDEQRQHLAIHLCQEIRAAKDARMAAETEVDYWHQLYEQARTRGQAPWKDAADLTSYIPSEKVDSLHARLMGTVWTEPIWTVEGWGEHADKAPFVEEFHQWKAEEERLQQVLDKIALTALVEPRCLVEVYESSQRRTSRKQIVAKPEQSDAGGLVLGTDARRRRRRTGRRRTRLGAVRCASSLLRRSPERRLCATIWRR